MHVQSLNILGVRLIFVLGSLGLYASCTKICPKGWIYYNCACYSKFLDKISWEEAYKTCQNLDAHILVLNSDGEVEFVRKVVQEVFPDSTFPRRMWLGCQGNKGQWRCLDGTHQHFAHIAAISQSCLIFSPFAPEIEAVDCSNPDTEKRVMCEHQLKGISILLNIASIHNEDTTMPYCLLGHAYKHIPIQHPIQCCLACSKDPKCRSFNLLEMMCQLNNATIHEVDSGKFVEKIENCAHY